MYLLKSYSNFISCVKSKKQINLFNTENLQRLIFRKSQLYHEIITYKYNAHHQRSSSIFVIDDS